jgi:AsmA protein
LKKFFKIFGITFISILALLIIIPYLIPKTISTEITKVINKNIDGEVQFKNTSLSFFNHFPSLTLSLNDFLLKGAAPFKSDTLISAKKLSLGINLLSIFSDQVKVDQFYLDNAQINLLVNENGKANYNVYKSSGNITESDDTSSTAIKIEGVFIKNSNLNYNDKSIPMLVKTQGLNYTGEGDLSQAVFDLKSKLSIEKIDLFYNNTPYLLNKKLNAGLLTKVNTSSLDLQFNENDLKINELPISFVGKFSFIKGGYDLDFKTSAKETDLHNIFTALPPEIADRLEKTKVTGYAEIDASIIGKYLAAQKLMPTLAFNMKIRDGYIMNKRAPEPISNLFLNLKTKLPNLNMDSLTINMDSLYFNIGKDYLASVLKVKGLNTPEIYTDTRTNIDLEKWAQVVNLEELALKGRLAVNLKADGLYSKKVVKSGIRQVDTVFATIPKFKLTSSLKGGYVKFAQLPTAISTLNFNFDGYNTTGDYKNTVLELNKIDVKALNNFITGFAKLKTENNLTLDLNLKSVFDLADIKNIYPIKNLDLNGKINFNIKSKGIYNKAKKQFPITTANILLNNGSLKTNAFPEALEKINVNADLTNTDGSFKTTKLNIKPISFEMASQPFMLKADIKNFDNVAYKVSSKGTIDIGKMYQFFAIKGYQVKGTINTNVDLKGLQSDAMAGKYANLKNKGFIKVNELNLQSNLFPKSFLIHQGLFSFFQDKMKFDTFKASYGKSDFQLNGTLNNVINYVLSDKNKLEGKFTLYSKNLLVDEFMVYANTENTNTATSSSKGVVIVPDNLNVNLTANADNVFYNGLNLKAVKGNLTINNGAINLKETGFKIIGAEAVMNANYKTLNTKSALFDFNVSAKEFDIAKAYKEIRLFREIASSASKVKGIVGLDYQLAGRLNDEMFPVLPSITGGGTLNLKQVSLLGFKMMNAVSKATNRDSLTNPNLKDVNIKTSIKNNILTIEQTKMKVAGFRPRFEGQVSLDGKLNLKGRLGLPPFGLFGIPLSITGTQDNPKVQLKRNKEGKLDETEDKESK